MISQLTLLHGHKQDHGNAYLNFVHWYDENLLELTVDKIKEMTIDLRKTKDSAVVSSVVLLTLLTPLSTKALLLPA